MMVDSLGNENSIRNKILQESIDFQDISFLKSKSSRIVYIIDVHLFNTWWRCFHASTWNQMPRYSVFPKFCMSIV